MCRQTGKAATKNGPSVHTKMPGMKQITKGNIRLTGSAMAKALARSRRRSRRSSAWRRRAWAMPRAQLLGLNQRRDEDRHGGDFQAAGQPPQGFHPRSARREIRLVGAELAGQGTIFTHRIEHPRQRGVETQPGLAQRGQQFQGDGQVLLHFFHALAAVRGERPATAGAPAINSTIQGARYAIGRNKIAHARRQHGDQCPHSSSIKPVLRTASTAASPKPDCQRPLQRRMRPAPRVGDSPPGRANGGAVPRDPRSPSGCASRSAGSANSLSRLRRLACPGGGKEDRPAITTAGTSQRQVIAPSFSWLASESQPADQRHPHQADRLQEDRSRDRPLADRGGEELAPFAPGWSATRPGR